MLNKVIFFLLLLVNIPLIAWADGFRVELPYENTRGKMMVKAKIDGIEGNFLFDTGAPVCLSYKMAQKLGLTKGETVRASDSNGRIIENTLVNLDAVSLGGVNFVNLKALLLKQGEIPDAFGVDGIIGYTLFGGSVVEFDARRKVIVITNLRDSLVKLPASAACAMDEGQPYLAVFDVGLNGKGTDRVMFDCGAAGFYELSDRSFERLRESGAFEVLAKGNGVLSFGAGGLENRSEKYRVKVPSFRLGDGDFTNVASITTSAGLSRLGSGILRFGKVVIDYPLHRFYYIPYMDKMPDLYSKEWNVVITVQDNELVAGFVWDSMKDKLEGGEKIVEVNGKRFDKVDPYLAMTTNLLNLTGDEAEIVIVDKKDGTEKRLKISRE